jgi:nicotinamidase-related amidase
MRAFFNLHQINFTTYSQDSLEHTCFPIDIQRKFHLEIDNEIKHKTNGKAVNYMERPAVIIIDMLNDFVTGELKTERAARIIQPLRDLIEVSRRYKIPVIYSNDAHYPSDHEVVKKWGAHAIKNTSGAKIIPELEPRNQDFIIEKRTYSGFYETGLEPLLRSFYNGRGVKTVILGGLHTHICIRHTSADAFFRGYEIVIAEDGVEAFDNKLHEEGMKYLKDIYNAELLPINEIIKEFHKNQ